MVTIYAVRMKGNPYLGAYVGSTKGKISKRFREHRCLLNQGAHKTPKLQRAWDNFGADAFQIDSLEVLDCGLDKRREAELKWMKLFEEEGVLYNEHRISMRPSDEAIRKGVANAHLSPGNRWTPEANEKRRLAQLGKPKGHGAKISATKRAKREQVMR
jgi:hypothetical protein